LIVQEILSQLFRRSHAGVVERCANLRKIHPPISQKGWESRLLFTKSCEQNAKSIADLYTSYSPPWKLIPKLHK
jgi:hypothetical protein